MEPSWIPTEEEGEEEQTQMVFDLIDMNDENLSLGGSASQQSANTGGTSDLRTHASIASSYNPLDCLSPHQESSFDQRSAQGATSCISYGLPGENPIMSPPIPHQSIEVNNLFGSGVIPTENSESFPKFPTGNLPLTPASSIFEDDFVVSPALASSPVWSHCSGDPIKTSNIAACTKSSLASSPPPVMYTAPPVNSFIGTETHNSPSAPTTFVVTESPQTYVANAPAPTAGWQELNHVGDSPSPAALSTHSATDTSGNSNRSSSSGKRQRACVSLQHLFDAEVAAFAQERTSDVTSIDDDNMQTGYLNPIATLSECETNLNDCDGQSEEQSLVSFDASPWKIDCNRQNVDAFPSPSVTSFNTVISDGPMCRICHEGDQASGEHFISPCHCTGTLQYLHRKCLEQWLQTRTTDVCELCNYEIRTKRKTRPLTEWFRHPSNPRDRRNLTIDVICGLILTPMVLVSSWLCLNGSSHYMHHQERSLEGMGLVLLAVVLILIFSSWGLLTTRYHYMVWREWSKGNQVVTVLTTESNIQVRTPMTSTPQKAAADVEGAGRRELSTTCSVSLSNHSSRVEATSV